MTLISLSLIRRLHRISSVVLIAFIAVHLTNHLAALAGIESHQQFMDAARVVYRSTFVEPLLLACVLIQIFTGLKQLIAGWPGRHLNRWRYAQLASGLLLLLFLVIHTSAILSIRHWLGLDSNFFAAAAVLVISPLQWFYAPYYWIGVLAVFVHLACLLRGRSVNELRIRLTLARATIGVGALVATAIMVAMGGWLYPIELPSEYRDAVMRFL